MLAGLKAASGTAVANQWLDSLVQRALEKLPGVAAVQLHGGDEEEVRVELDPARLAALGVTADEVAQAIRRDNINRPGGALTDQRSRYLVRTVHEARTPAELREVIVRSRAGAELRLGEVATVRRAPIERTELALVSGQDAVELAVYREGDANTVAVAGGVLEALPSLRLMPGEQVVVLSNQSSFIESAIAEADPSSRPVRRSNHDVAGITIKLTTATTIPIVLCRGSRSPVNERSASTVTYAARAKNETAITRRATRSRPSGSGAANCHATAAADSTSTMEPSPKAMRAEEDATVPAAIAMIASITL